MNFNGICMKKSPIQILGDLRKGVLWAAKHGTTEDLADACRHFSLYYQFCRRIRRYCLVLTELEGFQKSVAALIARS